MTGLKQKTPATQAIPILHLNHTQKHCNQRLKRNVRPIRSMVATFQVGILNILFILSKTLAI